MPPGSEKKQKSEVLQAVIQQGKVGFYPLNSLAYTAMFYGQADCAIGLHSDKTAQQLRAQSELSFAGETLEIQGKVFAGFSDAFYRGKLPELMIITCPMAAVPDFIEEFLGFLEKLWSLGFLMSQEAQDTITLLDQYVPQLVIASYGVVFDVIKDKYAKALDNMDTLSPRQRERLERKLSRGLFNQSADGYDLQPQTPTLLNGPLNVSLAGLKSMYTVRLSQLLEEHQIPYEFNPNGELGVLELELKLAYQHILQRLLPNLDKPACTEQEMTVLFDTLGHKLGILPGLLTNTQHSPLASSEVNPKLSATELAILHQLIRLVERAELSKERELLSTLFQQVQQVIQSNQPELSLSPKSNSK